MYQIDLENRLVTAQGLGTFTHEDIIGYQKEAWSRPELAGFNELVDMTAVEKIEIPTAGRMQQLAALSASMDAGGSSKFAIVAPVHLAYGLGRMYEVYRSLESGSKKEVGVFRTLAEARVFLGLSG